MSILRSEFIILGILLCLLPSTALARGFSENFCAKIFNSAPKETQKTQYFISRDILRQRQLNDEFINALSEIKQHPSENDMKYYKRLKNTAEDLIKDLIITLQGQSFERYRKQRQHINEVLKSAESELTKNQRSASLLIAKRHKDSLKELTKGVEQDITFTFDFNNQKNFINKYQRQVRFQIRQYQFILLYNHSLLHQFIEVSSGVTSAPNESLPSSYLSLNHKHNKFSDRILRLIESVPKLNPTEVFVDAESINKYFKKIDNIFSAARVLTHQVGLGDTIEKSNILKTLEYAKFHKDILQKQIEDASSIEDRADNEVREYKDEEFEGEFVSFNSVEKLTNYTDQVSQMIASHLNEIWALARLPLNGHKYHLNVTGEEISRIVNPKLKVSNHLINKEVDIFTSFNLFGDKKYFIGEVKFYQDPLTNKRNKNTDGKKNLLRIEQVIKQVKNMRKIMTELEIDNFDVHVFLINGVHLNAKLEIERHGAIVHGPIFN